MMACFSAWPSTATLAPITHVVNRDAGVLAQQVGVVFGNGDVADHGAEDGLAGGIGLRNLSSRWKPCLMSGRQHFERADVELLARFFHLFEIDLHECTFTGIN